MADTAHIIAVAELINSASDVAELLVILRAIRANPGAARRYEHRSEKRYSKRWPAAALDDLGGHISIASRRSQSVEDLWAWLNRHALTNYGPSDLAGPPMYCAQQAKERPEAPLDHRRLLDAGHAVVAMS